MVSVPAYEFSFLTKIAVDLLKRPVTCAVFVTARGTRDYRRLFFRIIHEPIADLSDFSLPVN